MVMEEILIDILKRLPVKSLIRFNCVSNFWNTLISQPYFKKKHLNHSKSQLSSQKLLFVRYDPNCQFWSGSLSLTEEDIPIFDCTSNSNPKDGVKMYSSYDGLFLIGIWTDRYAEQPSILVIWNPSIRQSIRLPHSKFSLQMGDQHDNHNEHIENDDENMGNYSNSISDDDNDRGSTYGWAYDSKNHEQIEDDDEKMGNYSSSISDYDDDRGTTYGLAYDSKSEDYKVFRIDMSGNNDNEILALKNGSWRIIDSKTSGRTDSGLLCGGELLAFVDGAFHWLGFLSKVCVISFNISDEIYGEISLPEIVSSELTLFKFDNVEVQVDVHVGLSVLRGMLGLYYKDDKDFCLWVMKKYGIEDSWMKLFTIPSVGCYKIVPEYAFSDDEVLLCFDQENWVTPEHVETSYVYKIISGGRYRMLSQDYDIDAVTVDREGFAYTETLTDIKL